MFSTQSVSENALTLSQTTDFRPFKTEIVCRRQFQISWKWPKVFRKGRKHCGKRLVMSNFSFPPSVFKRLLLQTCKNQGLFGKRLKATIQLLSAASFNLGQSQNGVLRNGLKHWSMVTEEWTLWKEQLYNSRDEKQSKIEKNCQAHSRYVFCWIKISSMLYHTKRHNFRTSQV